MTKPIVLYDQNHERVGETYPRRAKQLVRSGRAAWLEEGQSLLMNTDYMPYPPTKEDLLTMNEDIYQSNGNIVEEIAPGEKSKEESNDLLLYLAKQNVAEKKSLFRHIIAFIAAWPVIHVLGQLFSRGGVRLSAGDHTMASQTVHEVMYNMGQNMPRAHRMIEASRNNPSFFFNPASNTAYVWNNSEWINIWENMGASIEQLVYEFMPAHEIIGVASVTRTNFWWHFALGIMVAWGIFIAARGIKVLRRHRSNRAPKPDPVEMEYQRLKASI